MQQYYPMQQSVREAVAAAASTLAEAGVDSPLVDAELLAAAVLGVPRSRLAAAIFDPDAAERFRALVAARATRRPVQHLIGFAPFRWLELAVGPGVFIPRPETELLVDWGLARLAELAGGARPAGVRRPVVVDLCAGTGAIALSIAREHPGAEVYAVENSPEALEWLRRNVSSLTSTVSGSTVTVVEGDVTDPATLSTMDGQVDLVLCNPPYVPAGTPVPLEVAEYDPYPAVFAGPDGLDVIRPVLHRAAKLLHSGGWFGVEHDDRQGQAVPALLSASGAFADVADHPDLAGRPRFATARRLADCRLADCMV